MTIASMEYPYSKNRLLSIHDDGFHDDGFHAAGIAAKTRRRHMLKRLSGIHNRDSYFCLLALEWGAILLLTMWSGWSMYLQVEEMLSQVMRNGVLSALLVCCIPWLRRTWMALVRILLRWSMDTFWCWWMLRSSQQRDDRNHGRTMMLCHDGLPVWHHVNFLRTRVAISHGEYEVSNGPIVSITYPCRRDDSYFRKHKYEQALQCNVLHWNIPLVFEGQIRMIMKDRVWVDPRYRCLDESGRHAVRLRRGASSRSGMTEKHLSSRSTSTPTSTMSMRSTSSSLPLPLPRVSVPPPAPAQPLQQQQQQQQRQRQEPTPADPSTQQAQPPNQNDTAPANHMPPAMPPKLAYNPAILFVPSGITPFGVRTTSCTATLSAPVLSSLVRGTRRMVYALESPQIPDLFQTLKWMRSRRDVTHVTCIAVADTVVLSAILLSQNPHLLHQFCMSSVLQQAYPRLFHDYHGAIGERIAQELPVIDGFVSLYGGEQKKQQAWDALSMLRRHDENQSRMQFPPSLFVLGGTDANGNEYVEQVHAALQKCCTAQLDCTRQDHGHDAGFEYEVMEQDAELGDEVEGVALLQWRWLQPQQRLRAARIHERIHKFVNGL